MMQFLTYKPFKIIYLPLFLTVFLLSGSARNLDAQDAASTGGALNAKAAALIAMGIAAGLCGLGQGRAIGSTTEALARNPGTRGNLMTFLIIGLAFIESLTLFTFAMIIIKVK